MTKEQIEALPEEVNIMGNWETYEILIDEHLLNPKLSQKIVNHSIDLSWGYNGSGPSQTALAILMEFLPVRDAYEYYCLFKEDFVSHLPQSDFNVTINLKEKVLQYAKIDCYL